MKYDAVIVGASIAGLYTGMKLAQNRWSVVVVDRRNAVGVPVFCGGATGNRAELGRFVKIDESWIARDVEGLALHINNLEALSRAIPRAGVVLHRDKFEQALAATGTSCGMEIRLQTPVVGLVRSGEKCNGVLLENGAEVEADFLIGADGCESSVGRWAGLTVELAQREAFSSVQYTVESGFCNDGYLHFFVGSRVILRGYIWVFPKSSTTVSVGAGLYGSDHGPPKAGFFLEAFIASRMPHAAKRDLITGCVPLALCPRSLCKGNVVLVGDAARQCNPLTAAGIMNTLEAADLCVAKLLKSKGSRNHLFSYSRAWNKRPRREQKVFLVLKEVFLASSDDEISKAVRTLQSVFKAAPDRSRPFSFSLFKLLRLFWAFFPKVVRHWRILLS